MLQEWIMTKQAKDETDTLHIGENIQIQKQTQKSYASIWDKKHDSNIMRIGMNEEMNQDNNKTQMNSTKHKHKS